MILAKCARKTRVHHVSSLTGEAGLAFTLSLTVLPKAAHLATYSLRARRGCNVKLLSGWSGLVGELRSLGLTTGQDGFNCDFHAIRHHDADAHTLKESQATACPASRPGTAKSRNAAAIRLSHGRRCPPPTNSINTDEMRRAAAQVSKPHS